MSVLHNIDSKVFAQRWVKGRLPESTTTTTSSATAAAESQLSVDQQRKRFECSCFNKLLHMCYEEIKITRKNQDRANRMMKGLLVSSSSKSNDKNNNNNNNNTNDIFLPSLIDEDRNVNKNFSKIYGALLCKDASRSSSIIVTSTTQTPINVVVRNIKLLITPPRLPLPDFTAVKAQPKLSSRKKNKKRTTTTTVVKKNGNRKRKLYSDSSSSSSDSLSSSSLSSS